MMEILTKLYELFGPIGSICLFGMAYMARLNAQANVKIDAQTQQILQAFVADTALKSTLNATITSLSASVANIERSFRDEARRRG